MPLAVVLVGTYVLARQGQGGDHAPSAGPDAPATVAIGDRTQDRNWILGVFYFNRDDPSVFIQHRFGIGYTLNMARPTSRLIVLVALLIVAAVPLVIITSLH
ncbi:MAG: DUF5808 domain-containing protein [Vulcanimicrobiaceae bacterium]